MIKYIAIFLVMVGTAFSQSPTFKIDKIWERTLTLNGSDTLNYISQDVVPVASDSVAAMLGTQWDSCQVLVLFRPSLPDGRIDLTVAPDTVINKTTVGTAVFGQATRPPTAKQYGKFYIRIINLKVVASAPQKVTLWMIRRYI